MSDSARRTKVHVWRIVAAAAVLLTIAALTLSPASCAKNSVESEIQAVDALAESAITPYLDETGTVPADRAEDAVDAVYEKAKAETGGGIVKSVERGDRCTVIETKDGGYCVYLPPADPQPDADSAPYVPELPQTTGAGGRIATVEPYREEFSWKVPTVIDYPDEAARGIVQALPDYTFSDQGTADDDNYNDREVTLEMIKSLSDYSVIIWNGHGGYCNTLGSFLCTTTPYEKRYDNDYRKGRVVHLVGGGMGVTSKFIDAYLGQNNLPETLIYLGACSSARDNRLAQSFLDKGFDCVIANSDVITIWFTTVFQRQVLAEMSGESGTYMTSGEAFSAAQQTCGCIGSVYPGMPMLLGSSDVCFARTAAPTSEPTAAPTSEPTAAPTSEPTAAPTSEPTVAPTPGPTAEPTPGTSVQTDRGRDDPDYVEYAYLDETIAQMYFGGGAPTLPMDLAKMNACVIRDCFVQDGEKYITVDYTYWKWDYSDVGTLHYANTSSKTYTLRVAKDVLISMFMPDRNEFPDWDENDERSGFFKEADWDTLTRWYDLITDPGESWSQPTYFFLHFNAQDEVDCIWEDVFFYINN